MGPIWRRQLALGKAMKEFTGRGDSVFMTRFITPHNASGAKGIMRHYYGITPHWKNSIHATRDSLEAIGADPHKLLGVMEELQPLADAGAQVSEKFTAGAFGGGSTFPAQLTSYFKSRQEPKQLPGQTLVIVGVETDYCVLNTILGAIDNYYHVILVTDAVGSSQPNCAQAVIDYTIRRFDHMINIGSTQDVLNLLSASASHYH